MATLLDTIAKANTATTTASTKGAKPIGYINVKLADVTVFNRPIWAESTSEVPLFAEINEMALTSPESLQTLMEKLFVGNAAVTIEISMNRPKSDLSLADIMAELSK